MLITSLLAAAVVGGTFVAGAGRLLLPPRSGRGERRRAMARGGPGAQPVSAPDELAPPAAAAPARGNWTGEPDAMPHPQAKTWIAIGSTVAAGAGELVYPPLSLASVLGIVYIGKDIAEGAAIELRTRRRLSVDALALIITGACLAEGLLFACSLNLTFGVIARRFTARARRRSEGDILSAFELDDRRVRVLRDGAELRLPIAAVVVGDLVRVHAGETIPIDGVVESGSASIDQRVLTGEALPVERGPGEPVLAMTMVLAGTVQIRVLRAGPDTVVAEVARVLRSTMDQKTAMQIRAEDLGNRTVLPSLLLSAGLWPALGPSGALAVIQSHPKYKPIIASHLALLTAYDALVERGVLVKDACGLEALAEVDTVVFDKTGTLTLGDLRVVDVHPAGASAADLLHWAASLELNQSHPIARAIVAHAHARGLEPSAPADGEVVLGFGLGGVVDGRRVAVGSARFMARCAIDVPEALAARAQRSAEDGDAFVLVAADGRCVGGIALQATVRPEAQAVVRALRGTHGKRVHIISGDHAGPTRRLAAELEVDGFDAEVLPEGKARIVEAMRAEGRRVCFVGDGINDAAALAAADVSISLEGASTIARDAATVILLDPHLDRLPYLFERAAYERDRARWTLGLVTAPHAVGFVGAIGFGLGFIEAVVLNQVGLALGLGYVWHTRRMHGEDPAAADPPP